ncbi:hypothetical protein [Paenibacillus kribbensis]|uniref:hypothetical protein n=1 Tax=Paenibacillus kribbensis TaxID=172713 RepID=UPI00083810FB|nr:hypothetical protein [Paenibacillus kribbensis]
MKYLDEEIAKLEKEQRRQKLLQEQPVKPINEEAKAYPRQEETLNHEEIIIGVKNGFLDHEIIQLNFERLNILNTGISLNFPKDYFICALDTEEHLVFNNNDHAINFIFNSFEAKETFSMTKMKTTMIQQYKDMEIPVNWIEDGVMNSRQQEVNYCLFTNYVANGVVFNFLAFLRTGSRQLLININGTDQRRDLWKAIVEGMIATLEVES